MQLTDIGLLADYWTKSDKDFMVGMGVDLSKLPTVEEFSGMLSEQIVLPYTEKRSYGMIWQLDGKAIGHSNVNKIVFGKEAYMHLHLWQNATRKKGMGCELVKLTLPYFFKNLQLQTLYCEPYALNPAPNKTLPKVGFKFLRSYVTVPGMINFEQEVNLWQINATELNNG